MKNDISFEDNTSMIKEYCNYIESEIMKSSFVHADMIHPTPLNNPAQVAKNIYGIYGIPVFDPKKSFIMKVVVTENKKWYNGLWSFVKRLFHKKKDKG